MSNRLAAEKSPYLRQHADNPVDWYAWGDEAFVRARQEQKPIFLSIGYSTCHWCHVMAHESFENEAVALVLNRDFVSVKVDREERPDLDRVYMTYVQQTTGHGGWPMSVWLTPEAKPFYGGTYFPPEDRQGRPGFVTVLNVLAGHWRDDRSKIEQGAEEIVQALRRHAAEGGAREVGTGSDEPAKPLHEEAGDAFEKGYHYFFESHDETWGGFGGAPKFPRASVISFLFRLAALQGTESGLGASAVQMAVRTLQKMAEGGLHDHIGGGFHRYSVDEQWFVPHFEKMLYDQAQIATNLIEARQATGREVFAWLARDVFEYVARNLTAPAGGFYSAEDADSLVARSAPADGGEEKAELVEGGFYVWSQAELETELGPEAAFFCAHFDVKPTGNVAQDPQGEFVGMNILRQRRSLAETAREFDLGIEAASEKLLDCLARLRVVRDRRPRPQLDDKVITAWNGLMISALAKGAQVLGNANGDRDRWLGLAGRAAEFIERELYDVDRAMLYRSWREGRSQVGGFAEDYACLIQGLLDLYEAGFENRWLQWAVKLQATMDRLFWDGDRGGYFNSREGDEVIVRLKEDHDGAEPAPNSVAVLNLMRFEWMFGGAAEAGSPTSYRDRALRTIECLRPQWRGVPQALPQLLCAFELALTDPRTVVLAGDPSAPDFRALAAVVHQRKGLRQVLLAVDESPAGAAGRAWLVGRQPSLAGFKSLHGRAMAYVCEDRACRPPVSEEAELRQLLQ